MSAETTRKLATAHQSRTRPHTDWGAEVLLSPWLWGPLLTFGFYQLIPRLPSHQEFLTRYFGSHWILYSETGLFFLGMALLVRKTLGLFNESRALAVPLLEEVETAQLSSVDERAAALASAAADVPASLQRTRLVSRVRDLCDFIISRGSSSGLETHLRYLADMAIEGLGASYALVRTITWAIPILGFLGTVIGITEAISSIDIDKINESMPAMIAGLGVAFDTTALALTLSMALVFGTFLIERREGRILEKVEQFGIGRLAPLFPEVPAAAASPLAAAEVQAAQTLLQRTEQLITWQTDLWKTSLENLRSRWLETADQQQLQLQTALTQGMEATLANHSRQLDDTRGELLSGFRAVAHELSQVAEGLRESAHEHQNLFQLRVSEVWGQIAARLADSSQEQESRMAQATELFTGAVNGWQRDLSQVSEAMQAQLKELYRQGEILLSVTEREEELIRLQSTLTHNLQAVRAVEAFEEGIHSLNAAVHLLTVRTKAHAA